MEITNSFLFDFYSTYKERWVSANIEIKNLQALAMNNKIRVRYDSIKLYLDSIPCDKFIWDSNKELSVKKFFEIVMNSYLCNGTSFKHFNDEWNIFENLKRSFEEENGLVIKLPFYNGTMQLYDLELATPKYRFYHTIDEYLIINIDGRIITDKEKYYKALLYQTLLNICRDQEEMDYIYSRDEHIDEVIEEYGQEVGLILGGDIY